ncbi:MAG: class I SAM-dependent methyltransferase [Candidatus Paceibacterota bacterium]
MEIKKAYIEVFNELFHRGEIIKAFNLVNYAIPLELKDDPQIIGIKDAVEDRINEFRTWSKVGRKYPGTHATVNFDDMPKFPKAKEIIRKRYPKGGNILDLGCYSGSFIFGMRDCGYKCTGIDVHKQLMEKLGSGFHFGATSNTGFPNDTFDITTAFDVLEHVLDFWQTLEEIERVCKPNGLIIINLPRMIYGYKDESLEHVRMFDDDMINKIWGHKKDYDFQFCKDELDNPTSFITYTNEK